MPRPPRADRPADLIDWRARHDCVYDLEPSWRVAHPDVAGLRTPEEVERLRSSLLAGHPFRTDPLAPRLLTDRGQRIAQRLPFVEPTRDVTRGLVRSGWGILLIIFGPLMLLAAAGELGAVAVWITVALLVAYPVTVAVASRAIKRETVHPVPITYHLRPEENATIRDVRLAVLQITASRAYREGYLEQHRSLVDLDATADAITRRVVDMSQVRSQVNRLSGPVRQHADQAMRQVQDSLATQVRSLQSYRNHVRQLDRHLSDADSNVAAGEVFEAIRGLLASTVEDEQQVPQLSDAVEVTQATSRAITATVQDAAADLHQLLGTQSPSLPDLR